MAVLGIGRVFDGFRARFSPDGGARGFLGRFWGPEFADTGARRCARFDSGDRSGRWRCARELCIRSRQEDGFVNAAAGYNAALYVHGLSGVREVLRNVN